MSLPENWQQRLSDSLKKTREASPGETIFGVRLPEAWRTELQPFVRNGELLKLFGVKSAMFDGQDIGTYRFEDLRPFSIGTAPKSAEPPPPKIEEKKTPKSKR